MFLAAFVLPGVNKKAGIDSSCAMSRALTPSVSEITTPVFAGMVPFIMAFATA